MSREFESGSRETRETDKKMMLDRVFSADDPVGMVLQLTKDSHPFRLSEAELGAALAANDKLALIAYAMPSIAKRCLECGKYKLDPNKLFDKWIPIFMEGLERCITSYNKDRNINVARSRLLVTSYVDSFVAKAYGIQLKELALLDTYINVVRQSASEMSDKQTVEAICGLNPELAPINEDITKTVAKIRKGFAGSEPTCVVYPSGEYRPVEEEQARVDFLANFSNEINELPLKEKIVIKAKYYEGKTFAETGEILGVSKNWIRQLESSAIHNLRIMHKDRTFVRGFGSQNEIFVSNQEIETALASSKNRTPLKENPAPKVTPKTEKIEKHEKEKPVLNWGRDDFSRYLIDVVAGERRLHCEEYPSFITPSKVWGQEMAKVGYAGHWTYRTKKYVVADREGQIRFSKEIPENMDPMGFKGKSLIEDDASNRYALRVFGDMRFQDGYIMNELLGRVSGINLETIFDFLTDDADLLFRVVKDEKNIYWLFASEETKAKKHGDFNEGLAVFRDRWLTVAGVNRKDWGGKVFSSNGVPWSNNNKNIWEDVCRKICEYYKLVVYKENTEGVLVKTD